MANPITARQFKVTYTILNGYSPIASSDYVGTVIDAAIMLGGFEVDLDQVTNMGISQAGNNCTIYLSNGSTLRGTCKGKITLLVAGIKQSILFDFSTPNVGFHIHRIDNPVP
jgi:hypothetical protein